MPTAEGCGRDDDALAADRDRRRRPGGQAGRGGFGFLGFGCFLGFLSPTIEPPAGSDRAILRDAHGMGEYSCDSAFPLGCTHSVTASPWPACGSACESRSVRSTRHSSSDVAVICVVHVATCGAARSMPSGIDETSIWRVPLVGKQAHDGSLWPRAISACERAALAVSEPEGSGVGRGS